MAKQKARKKKVLNNPAAARKLDPATAAKLRAKFRTLPLSDAFMFGEVMRIAALCVRFLEYLLHVEIERIVYLSKEHDISESATAHGIRVDIYLRDDKGTVYSIEMDTSGSASVYARRMRFNQSAIDRNNLKKGEDYTNLPDTFLIVVGREDFFRKGLALYRRKMLIEGYASPDGDEEKSVPDFPYDDGTQLYYLNADCAIYNVPPEIKEFLRCIRDNDTNPAHYQTDWMKAVCQRIEDVRDDPAEEAYFMHYSTMIMDIRRAERAEGRAEGRLENLRENVMSVAQTLGKTLGEAMDILRVTPEDREILYQRLSL